MILRRVGSPVWFHIKVWTRGLLLHISGFYIHELLPAIELLHLGYLFDFCGRAWLLYGKASLVEYPGEETLSVVPLIIRDSEGAKDLLLDVSVGLIEAVRRI